MKHIFTQKKKKRDCTFQIIIFVARNIHLSYKVCWFQVNGWSFRWWVSYISQTDLTQLEENCAFSPSKEWIVSARFWTEFLESLMYYRKLVSTLQVLSSCQFCCWTLHKSSKLIYDTVNKCDTSNNQFIHIVVTNYSDNFPPRNFCGLLIKVMAWMVL